MKRVALAAATAAGAGYVPVAPGTAGSAVGVVIYLLVRRWPAFSQVLLLAVIVVVGIWSAGEAAIHFGREDPGQVVIDEVAGQFLTLMFTGAGMTGAVVGFVLFRLFDIVKPWPARQLEHLPGGWGIMADDLMAGVYGWIVCRLAVQFIGMH
jgi:phosphatidylglycerophosphatase A